jgi:hypothetical protein
MDVVAMAAAMLSTFSMHAGKQYSMFTTGIMHNEHFNLGDADMETHASTCCITSSDSTQVLHL